MAYVNFQRSYIRFKIVYYGPGLCGKTTNLEELHKLSGGKVEMVSLETQGDRTIFFDYMPLNLGKLGGIETVLKLYTVPGQVRYNRTRKMVLRDVDGVVFVADSQRSAMADNLESLKNLEENLAEEGLELASVPVVFQYNKRDLDDLVPLEELEERLNPNGYRSLPASALKCENVKETLTAISEEVYKIAAVRYGLRDSVKDRAVTSGSSRDHDNWSSISEAPPRRVSSRPAARKATIPPNKRAAVATTGRATSSIPGIAGSEFEQRVTAELQEIREMLQQVLLSQVEQETVTDFQSNVTGILGQLQELVERAIETSLSSREVLKGMEGRIDDLRADLRADVKNEVDRYLSNYLADLEDIGAKRRTVSDRPPTPSRPPAAPKHGGTGRQSQRSMLKATEPPPRKRAFGVGYYSGPGGKD